MIKLVICTIHILSGTITYDDLSGKVLAENDIKYAVDFSIDAKKNGYKGNYSQVLVDKGDCVVLSETK